MAASSGTSQAYKIPLATFRNHAVKVHHVLWYACSFLGVAWICFAYQSWRNNVSARQTSRGLKFFNAMLFAVLVLPVAVIHHSVGGVSGALFVAVCSVLLLAGAVWRIG